MILRDGKGQAVIEMAVVLPILLFLVLAMATFGVMINTKVAVTGAAREAARCYAVYGDESRMRQVAEDYLRGTVTASSQEFSQSFNRNSDVSYSVSGGYVTVTVSYHQPVFAPGLFRLLGSGQSMPGRVTLRSAAVFRVES